MSVFVVFAPSACPARSLAFVFISSDTCIIAFRLHKALCNVWHAVCFDGCTFNRLKIFVQSSLDYFLASSESISLVE